jgi:hypothetical protein
MAAVQLVPQPSLFPARPLKRSTLFLAEARLAIDFHCRTHNLEIFRKSLGGHFDATKCGNKSY